MPGLMITTVQQRKGQEYLWKDPSNTLECTVCLLGLPTRVKRQFVLMKESPIVHLLRYHFLTSRQHSSSSGKLDGKDFTFLSMLYHLMLTLTVQQGLQSTK